MGLWGLAFSSEGDTLSKSGGVQVADIEKAEKEKMRTKVENIISQGLNCFVNRQLIYNFPEEIFADAGVMAIEHADFDGIERLALVTGQHLMPCYPSCAPFCVSSTAIVLKALTQVASRRRVTPACQL